MPITALPSFSQLRAFVALCDHQHFGEAASTLGVSQPSLSQAITALEKRVGGELVERTTRRVHFHRHRYYQRIAVVVEHHFLP